MTKRGKLIKILAKILFYATTLSVFTSESFSQIYRLENNYGSRSYFESKEFYDNDLLFKSDFTIQNIKKRFPETIAKSKLEILEADISLLEGDYFTAKAELEEFIKDMPNSPYLPFAYYKKAQILFELKRFDYASIDFNQAKISARENFAQRGGSEYKSLEHKANYWEAVSAALYGSYNDAKEIFEEVLASTDSEEFADDALFALGQTAESYNRYEEAINYYRRIRTDYKFSNNYLRALIRESNNLLSLRDPAASIALLEKTNTAFNHISIKDTLGKKYQEQTDIEGTYQEILYLKGEASNIAGNHKEAITYFVSFLETYEKSEIRNLVLLGLGWAYLNTGQYDAAIRYYDKILNTDSDRWNSKDLAELYKATTLKQMGEKDKALDQFSALAVDSDYKFLGEVLLELGQMYYESADYESAKRTLERADREAIDVLATTKIYLLLGASYMELKLWQKAITYYNKAENIAKNTDDIYLPQKQWYLNELRFKRGVAFMMSGKSNKGIKDLSAYIAEEKQSDRLEKAYFWLGESYYASDLYKNSEQAYNSLLVNYPRSIYKEEALYGLGWSLFNQGKFSQSANIFSQLVDEFPKSNYGDEVLARQADAYYKTRSFLNAANSYNKVYSNYPDSEEAEYSAYQETQALYRAGRIEQAVSKLQKFAFNYSESQLAPNAMFLKGWIRLQQNRFDDAVANFTYLLDAFPNSEHLPITRYSIGTAYYNKGEYDNSAEAYLQVMNSYPNSDYAKKAAINLQEIAYITGKDSIYIPSVVSFENSSNDDPFVYDIKKNRASNLFSSGRPMEAIEEYQKLINDFPDKSENAEAVYWIARSYVSMDQPEDARKAFETLFKDYPKSDFASDGMLNYGNMYLNMNDQESADSIFAILMNTYPASLEAPEAGYQRGRLAMVSKDTLGSIKLFTEVADNYKISPYGLDSRRIVATVYKRQGKIDSSISQWQILAAQVEGESYQAEAQYMLGRMYKEQEDYYNAIKELLIVKENFSNSEKWYPQALIDLGEIYEKQDEWELALENYNVLIELFPDSEFGKTAKTRAKRVKKMIK